MTWYHESSNSPKVMPSSEHNPWEFLPKNPDSIETLPSEINLKPCPCPGDKCKITEGDLRHGTINAYKHQNCRCRPCRDANAMRFRKKLTDSPSNEPVKPQVDQSKVQKQLPRELFYDNPDDPRHGTLTGYVRYNCKCEPCKEAKNTYRRQKIQENLDKGLPKDDPRHGTTNGYSYWGCRCEPCTEATRSYQRQKKQNRQSSKWYHKSSKYEDCHFCGGISHMYHNAAKAEEFHYENPEVIGLPRPYYKPREKNLVYQEGMDDTSRSRGYEPGDRKLFRRVPMPWNSNDAGINDIPDFSKDDNLEGTSQSLEERRCPMCGDHFENDDKAVVWDPEENKFGAGDFISDLLPYHEKCMRLVQIHCPHLRNRSNDEFVQGTYGDLMDGLKSKEGTTALDLALYRKNKKKASSDITSKEIYEAGDVGWEAKEYRAARAYGATHNEILEAARTGSYVDGTWIHPVAYWKAKRAGVSHSDIMDANKRGCEISDYAVIRGYNATHEEALEALEKGIMPLTYAMARFVGSNHSEILKAHEIDPGINKYLRLLSTTGNHKEAYETVKNKIDDFDYMTAREAGATHDEILDANSKGINTYAYSVARQNGATHEDTLDAYKKGLHIFNYAMNRKDGASHTRAICNQIPDYNPYNEINWKNSSRSVDEVTGDTSIGVGKRIHELRFDNGMPFDTAIDAVGDKASYMSRDKLIKAYQKHLTKTLANGVQDPHEEAFMQSELDTRTSSVLHKNASYGPLTLDQLDEWHGLTTQQQKNYFYLRRQKEFDNFDGIDHDEAMQVAKMPIDPEKHRLLRTWGTTKNQALFVFINQINTNDYLNAINAGVTHEEFMDANATRMSMTHYTNARRIGATHDEIMEAHKYGIKPLTYSYHRQYPMNHKDILRKIGEGYNPYSEINWKMSSKWYLASSKPTGAEMADADSKNIGLDGYAYARAYGATHNETLDAHDRGINIWHYALSREHGATHNEILDAHDKGIDLHGYSAAKQKNNTHYEILKKLIPDYNPYSEINWKNASSDEYKKAPCQYHDTTYLQVPGTDGLYVQYPYGHCMRCNTNIGSDTHLARCYTDEDARWVANGIANEEEDRTGKYSLTLHELYHFATNLTKLSIENEHFDVPNIKKVLLDTKANMYRCHPDYNPYSEIKWKKSMKTHSASNEPTEAELNDAHYKGINLHDYSAARAYGATHNEILDAHSKGINLDGYDFARAYGATHNEILDADSKGIYLDDYAYARKYGANHNEILDAHSKGIGLEHYCYARESGATHNEILDAHDRGINLFDYVEAKQKNNTHYEILKVLIKGYNPYSEIKWKKSMKWYE